MSPAFSAPAHPAGRRWAYRTGRPGGEVVVWGPKPPAKSLRERVEEKIDRSGPGCALWTGAKDRRGYGSIRVAGRTLGAARVVWRLAHGDDSIPAGRWVCHACDVPACVALDHLYLRTGAARQGDKRDRGRAGHPPERRGRMGPRRPARGDASGARLHPERLRRGEQNPAARLSEADVLAIREAHGRTHRDLAAEYGITTTAVGLVRRGRNWAHVGGTLHRPGRGRSEVPRARQARLSPEETREAVLALTPSGSGGPYEPWETP